MSGGIVDHIDLAGIKAGFQAVERKIQLKNARLAIARIQFAQFNQRAFVDFRLAAEKGDIREQVDPGLCLAAFRI